MGAKDALALTHPMVTLEVFEQLPGGGKGASLGPGGGDFGFLFQDFFLDTGATSIIALNGAVEALEENGFTNVNTVEEQGVAGTTELYVSAEYYLEITDIDSTLALPHTRIMSGQIPELLTVNGIVGMPAMVGKVVTLDTGRWEELAELDPFDPDDLDRILELSSLGLNIGNSLSSGAGHRYSVPLRAQTFPVIGEEPLPVEAPIPFIEVTVGNGNRDATGQFIFDTGASVSFISTEMGRAIGLDSNHDGVLDDDDDQFFESFPIGGIGGSIDAPMFVIDRFAVTTEQGVDLVWSLEQSITVLIVDIHPDIDGVLGSEVLISGWFELSDEEQEFSGFGPLQYTHLDFRQFFADDDTGKAYFDLTPSFDAIQPGPVAGDYNRDGVVDAGDYVTWRNTLGSEILLNADGNGNKIVDAGDYQVWKNNFGATGPSGPGGGGFAVPEPGAALLMALSVALAALARRAPLIWPVPSAASTSCGASDCG